MFQQQMDLIISSLSDNSVPLTPSTTANNSDGNIKKERKQIRAKKKKLTIAQSSTEDLGEKSGVSEDIVIQNSNLHSPHSLPPSIVQSFGKLSQEMKKEKQKKKREKPQKKIPSQTENVSLDSIDISASTTTAGLEPFALQSATPVIKKKKEKKDKPKRKEKQPKAFKKIVVTNLPEETTIGELLTNGETVVPPNQTIELKQKKVKKEKAKKQPKNNQNNTMESSSTPNSVTEKKFNHRKGRALPLKTLNIQTVQNNGLSPVPVPKSMDSLPIHEFSSPIINAIEENQVTVITGFTGCGKSTQLPQIILKHYIENSNLHRLRKIKIVCTQPRRLAATSLARRVNNEMKTYLHKNEMDHLFKGRVAGHIIGGESILDHSTPIVYATEGCLTQIIMGMHSSSSSSYEKFHQEFSHIVLDEIHERKVDTDLLLYFVREIVKVNPKIRIILMSATLSQEKICKYFETYLNVDTNEQQNGEQDEDDELFVSNIEKKVPSIHIPSGCYPVTENYIEDVIQILYNSKSNPLPPEDLLNKPQFRDLLSKPLRALIKPERRVLGSRLIEYLHGCCPLNQSILVFLPGMMEIEDFADDLTANFIGGVAAVDCPYDIHILHSLIAEQEQEESLLPPKEGKRKIILSTNIAESSITVPDVVIVIDFCLCKGKYWNENFNAEVMGLDWISKDSAKQRKGRAGRVSPGILYRMITREEFELLDESVVPEIQRKPLSSVVLQILMFNGAYIDDLTEFNGLPKNYKTPSEVLRKCLDPPNQTLLEQAYVQLESLGAIFNHQMGSNQNSTNIVNQYELDEAYLVTNIGKFFSQIPTELNAAYLLLIGYSLNLLPECIIIVSILSRSVPILAFSSLKLLTARALYSFDNGSESDLISGFNAYNRFKQLQIMKREHKITPRDFSNQLAKEMIASKKMIEIDSLVIQISQALYRSYGIFINNITPNTVKHTKQVVKLIEFSNNEALSTDKMNTIKSLIATLYYEQAVKGTLKKEQHTIQEIECSLQIRNQALSLTNPDEMKKVLVDLFNKFDGGVVNCKKITFPTDKKINISYSLPVSDQSFIIPYTDVQKKDPLFPVKMLQRMVKGTSQDSKEKNQQTLDYAQVRQSMLSVRDDEQIYGIFRGLSGDLVKSHGLKFKSVSTAFDRKVAFIHPQSDTYSKQRIIFSRDSVSHPWIDLITKDKILIPGSVSIKDMVMVLDKNTTLPNIDSFYEMSLLLFLPLIYPRRYCHFKPSKDTFEEMHDEQNFFLISDLFEKMNPHEKTEFIRNKIKSELNSIYLISSNVKNFDLILQTMRDSIQKKINELLSCQPILDVGALPNQVNHLLNNGKNFLSHSGYNKNISKIVTLSPIEEDYGGEDDASCGANILRTSSFQRISQRILNLLAKQCLLSTDDLPVEIKKKGKTTIEITCMQNYQYMQAKYLLLREINNDYAVFAHPKQAFVCLEVEKKKKQVEKFLSSKVYFSYYEDRSGKNREFYTINRIPATKNDVTIDESRECNEVSRAFNIKIKSDKLTNGGFLLEPFTIKPAVKAFIEKVNNADEYMQVYAYFGKQVFYQSKAGATKIHSQQKGLSFASLKKMKIGNDNDVKTLFLHFIDARRQPDDSLISNFLSSKNGDMKESVFSTNRYFKSILSNKELKLGKQKEYISLNIVDMEKRERFTIVLHLDRQQIYNDGKINLVKCSSTSWRRSDTKLIYLDFVSPIIVNQTDDSELINHKNENTIDVRFAKVTHSKTIKEGYRQLLPSSILELEECLWYDINDFTLYYCYERDETLSFANLNALNLSFGSTMENDELCELRKNTPLARLSIDSIHYDIKENLHFDNFKIQFKNRTDISHPTQRKSFTTLRVCNRYLQGKMNTKLQKNHMKEFIRTILLWKKIMNENSLN